MRHIYPDLSMTNFVYQFKDMLWITIQIDKIYYKQSKYWKNNQENLLDLKGKMMYIIFLNCILTRKYICIDGVNNLFVYRFLG